MSGQQDRPMRLRSHLKCLAALPATFAAGAAAAQSEFEGLPIIGAPVDRAMGFQPAVTDLARDLQWLDGFLLVIITVISLFVLALLGWCIVRFNQRANPEPAGKTKKKKKKNW
eukprot:TRINITY_DN56204_c0_g1_i1.p3 TRINITY_DN56204_c0_g1~~TRINITY_DN56204_c0_g1_i1.p3  ORF type:complete len:113 (+),score=11.52 TRINITY_DN56204_c0_g1_i1:57-395(+)